MKGVYLQKKLGVQFKVNNQQCEDCRKSFTPHTWEANVQIRQKVDHKRTFLFLEQILLKYNALADCMRVVEIHDGLDFHFKERNDAVKFVEFVQAKFIIR